MRKDVQPESIEAYLLAAHPKNEAIVIAAFMRAADGCTDDELMSTGLPFGSVGSTRHSLMKKGLVLRTQRRRLTRNGRYARVYILAPTQLELIGDVA